MGVTERKTKERLKRRNAIIKAAKKVFSKVGFANATMDIIAREAQLSKGTLYLYFHSKDDLYLSLLLDGLNTLAKKFENAEKKGKELEEILVDYGLAYYEFSEEYPDLFKIMLDIHTGDFISHENVSVETLDAIKHFEEKFFLFRMNAIQGGIESGHLHSLVNSCYATTMLWTIITGAVILAKNYSKSRILENISPKMFISDLIKVFIVAHSTSGELIEKYRMEIIENAFAQVPNTMHEGIILKNIKINKEN